jgi:hypothetical protein
MHAHVYVTTSPSPHALHNASCIKHIKFDTKTEGLTQHDAGQGPRGSQPIDLRQS